jgi:hypothetical protein
VDERWDRHEPHEWRMWRKGEVIDRGKQITTADSPA